jgi:hypothetical protein
MVNCCVFNPRLKFRHPAYWCDHCHWFEGYSGIGPAITVHCNGCESVPHEIYCDRGPISCFQKSWGSQ